MDNNDSIRVRVGLVNGDSVLYAIDKRLQHVNSASQEVGGRLREHRLHDNLEHLAVMARAVVHSCGSACPHLREHPLHPEENRHGS